MPARRPKPADPNKASGKVYPISHYQILQGNQVRGYPGVEPGRRVLAQPMANSSHNVANPNGPAGSTKIAADGSTAVFVPANRALAWQTTDASGEPVVRERVWVTMQAGEIRTCAGCHGEAGHGTDQLPRLAGQVPRYIEDQLRSFNKRERTNDNAVMHAIASKMSPLEMAAVAEYLSGK